jgi:flagellar biosynthesis protein FlhB
MSKTEDPTPRRLRKAREQGDSATSHVLGQTAGLAAAVLLVPGALAATAARFAELVQSALSEQQPLDPSGLAFEVVSLSVPLLLAVAFAGAAATLVQTGGVMSGAKISPSLARLDPAEGLKNLFRLERGVGIVRALVGALAVAALGVIALRDHAADVANTAGNPAAIAPVVISIGKGIGWSAVLVGLLLSAVDLAVSRRAFLERHRMTKDEVRREYREAEGDPELKAKRRRAHQEALTGSILNAVKEATVVIVNPTHLANALRYVEGEDLAPRVVATGQGELAKLIVEAARAYGIPCIQDVPVARALAELEIGDEIPEALYEAVAEILREVMKMQDPSRQDFSG